MLQDAHRSHQGQSENCRSYHHGSGQPDHRPSQGTEGRADGLRQPCYIYTGVYIMLMESAFVCAIMDLSEADPGGGGRGFKHLQT